MTSNLCHCASRIHFETSKLWLVLIFTGLQICWSTAKASDTTTPLEQTLAAMRQGNAAQARTQLENWLKQSFDDLHAAQWENANSPKQVTNYAILLRSAAALSSTWQSAEIWLANQNENAIPPESITRMLLQADDVFELHAHRLATKLPLQTEQVRREINGAIEASASYLMRSNVFVKHTHHESQRQDFIDRAQRLIKLLSLQTSTRTLNTIRTVQDFDLLFGEDPINTLNFIPQRKPINSGQ